MFLKSYINMILNCTQQLEYIEESPKISLVFESYYIVILFHFLD